MVSGENKRKDTVLVIARLLVSLLVYLAAFAAGAYMKSAFTAGHIWLAAVALALAFLIGASCLADWLLRKRLKKQKVAQGTAMAEEHRLRITADPVAARRRMTTACALAVAYCVLVAVLSLLLAFFEGVAGKAGDIGSLFSLYLIYGFVTRIIVPRQKRDHSAARSRDEFPELYRVAGEAAAEMGVDGRIHIFTHYTFGSGGCNASVGADKGDIFLYLSVILLCVLDRNELKQILLHEFAHLEGGQHAQDRSYYRLMDFLSGDGSTFSIWTSLAVRFPLTILILEGMFYMQFSSKHKESLADLAASTAGSRQAQASALAKTNAYELYLYEREPYVNFYREETVPKNFVTDQVDAYRKALLENGDRWRQLLENELPSRSASHPTFRQRWEALGMCPYSMKPSETESAYALECRKAAKLADEPLASAAEEYGKERQKNYVQLLEITVTYEADPGDYTPETLRPVIDAYYGLGEPEKAEAICDRILREYDSPFATAYASFRKGQILLRRYDHAGIDLIYGAMQTNTNYIEGGLETIGHYCCMMGLQKELDEYRLRAPEFMQLVVDRSGGEISAKANLSPETLPDDWQDRIVQYARNAGGEALTHVYLVREQISDDFARSAFILRFAENADPEIVEKTCDKVFALLDDWPVDWEFSLYVYEPSMDKGLQKVKGSCVFGAEK